MSGFDATRYFLGRLCKNNHEWGNSGKSLRNLSKKDCLQCLDARRKKWTEENPDKVLESRQKSSAANVRRATKWKKANPEKVKASSAKRYQNKKEQMRVATKSWEQRNPRRKNQIQRDYRKTPKGREILYLHVYKRVAMKKNCPRIPYALTELATHFVSYGDCCVYCGKTGRLTIDHVIALTKGGIDALINIVPACKSCNSSKRDKDVFGCFSKQAFFSEERWVAIKELARR